MEASKSEYYPCKTCITKGIVNPEVDIARPDGRAVCAGFRMVVNSSVKAYDPLTEGGTESPNLTVSITTRCPLNMTELTTREI